MTAWPNSVHSGGELRRLSRRYSTVGVDIAPERLREIADGAPATEGEWVDVTFAMVATNLQIDARRIKRGRARRRLVHWGIVAGAVVVALNVLLCLGLLFFVMTQHASPY
ncbi:MAG: hypothetical protein KIH64_007985 [Mycobacterium sp.]|nr:hypothetical protein [Mycobacterium sp.]